MIRLFLRAANAPALILIVALGIAIQTSFFASPPLSYLQPDVVLIAVVWCGLKRSFTEGGILTLLFGNVAEIHSAAPQGAFLIGYMAIYLLVRLASKVLVMPTRTSLVFLTMGASIAWRLVILLLLHLLGGSANLWRHTVIYLFPGAVVEGVLALWAYRALDRFDWITFKSPRAQQLLENELQLEGEGL